jgi:pSer/pThr/pTyr-binding forkhead associated (FHA) protein
MRIRKVTDEAGRPRGDNLRLFFERQQQRRLAEQYRRTGHPRPRGSAPDYQDAEAPTVVRTIVAAPIDLPRFRLVGLSGEERGETLKLRTGRMRVGRDPSCEIRFSDLSVSHFHAALTVGKQGATIEDLGSMNHTYVNDELAEGPRSLAVGDTIRLGSVMLLFEEEPHAAGQ